MTPSRARSNALARVCETPGLIQAGGFVISAVTAQGKA